MPIKAVVEIITSAQWRPIGFHGIAVYGFAHLLHPSAQGFLEGNDHSQHHQREGRGQLVGCEDVQHLFGGDVSGGTQGQLTFQNLREQIVNTEGRLKIGPDYYNFLREPGLHQGANTDAGKQEHRFH